MKKHEGLKPQTITEIKHFAYIKSPVGGSNMCRSTTVEIKKRNISEITFPKDATSFYYYDKIFCTTEYKGKKVVMESDDLNSSEIIYIGKVFTKPQEGRRFLEVFDGRIWEIPKEAEVADPNHLNYEKPSTEVDYGYKNI